MEGSAWEYIRYFLHLNESIFVSFHINIITMSSDLDPIISRYGRWRDIVGGEIEYTNRPRYY